MEDDRGVQAREWVPLPPDPEPVHESEPDRESVRYKHFDTSGLRRASQVGIGRRGFVFPYEQPTVTFIGISYEGKDDEEEPRVIQATNLANKVDLLDLIRRQHGGGLLLAVWPGKTRSDVFVVDNFKEASVALSGALTTP